MTQQTNSKELSDLIIRVEDVSSRILDMYPLQSTVAPALLLTSARPAEGKTTVALAMAKAMALASGDPILLVDANFHKPGLAQIFNLEPSLGLADALRAPSDDKDLPNHLVGEGVSLICAGEDPLPLLLTRGQSIASFRERYTKDFRFVIFDGANSRMGGAALAKHVDGVVLIIDAKATRREVVNYAINDIRLHDGYLIGAVLNKSSRYIPSALYKSF